jgi:PAS domain S-box-containing protein
VWPATAFLTGALLITPVRYWWTYLLGLIPAHFQLVDSFQHPRVPLVVAATQIAGNVASAAVVGVAVRRLGRTWMQLDTFKGVLAFIVIGGIAVPAVANVVILSVHVLTGWAHDLWTSWRQWMLAGIFPAITLTPLMVLAGRAVADRARPQAPRQAMSLLAALFIVTLLAFGGRSEGQYLPELELAPLPFILWFALRWGVGGASISLLVFASAIIVRALSAEGPFAAGASAVSVISLQIYLTGISIAVMLLAAAMEERRRVQERLEQSESRMAMAAASTDTGLWQWDAAAGQLWMTEHCRRMFGFISGAIPAPHAFIAAVHPDDQSRVRGAVDEALASNDARALTEFRIIRAGGDERWFTMRTHAEQNASGRLARVSGVFRDITEGVESRREAEQLSARLLTLQEEERRSIAQALHDSTTQHLVAARLTLGMLERRAAPGVEVRKLFADLRASLGDAIRELRTFTYLLRPPELERQGLGRVLQRYFDGFGLRTGLSVTARLDEAGDDLPLEQQHALLRIAQEALANIHRHALAAHVSVRLRRHGRDLHFIVRDDGCGIKATAGGDAPLGVGVPGMAARVRQLGGKFGIRSRGKGTTVHVALPLSEPQTPEPAEPSLASEFSAENTPIPEMPER